LRPGRDRHFFNLERNLALGQLALVAVCQRGTAFNRAVETSAAGRRIPAQQMAVKLIIIVLGVLSLILLACVIYLGWLWVRFSCYRRSAWRAPEVARDGTGRPLKERV
jgi:hypothetical protein